MLTRYFALVIGITYVLAGLAGFIPALGTERTTPDLIVDAQYRNVLGLFPANILHHLVHLAIGILGILAYRSYANARSYSRVLAVVYGLLAVMGLIEAGNINTTFELIPLFSHDIWLHALTALAAAYFGFMAPRAADAPVPGGTRAGGAY